LSNDFLLTLVGCYSHGWKRPDLLEVHNCARLVVCRWFLVWLPWFFFLVGQFVVRDKTLAGPSGDSSQRTRIYTFVTFYAFSIFLSFRQL